MQKLIIFVHYHYDVLKYAFLHFVKINKKLKLLLNFLIQNVFLNNLKFKETSIKMENSFF